MHAALRAAPFAAAGVRTGAQGLRHAPRLPARAPTAHRRAFSTAAAPAGRAAAAAEAAYGSAAAAAAAAAARSAANAAAAAWQAAYQQLPCLPWERLALAVSTGASRGAHSLHAACTGERPPAQRL
jgi:hypothetical protein